MIDNIRIEAVIYDAGMHCPPCAEAKFGQKLYNRFGPALPPEGDDGERATLLYNFGWETNPAGEYCDTCHAEIAAPDEDYDPGGE